MKEDGIRLDKAVANATVFSRSEVRKMILKGLVTVDGCVCRLPDTKVRPDSCTICVEQQPIAYKVHRYFLMNKPAGVLTACEDRRQKTVVDLIRPEDRTVHVFPVGRLDKDTTGLLLLTDDGELAHRVIHPKNGVPKCYRVVLDGPVGEDVQPRFAEGVVLADGTICAPAQITQVCGNEASLVLTEGKYHEVKRMFGTVGLGVVQLHRQSIGRLELPESLAYGDYVEITRESIEEACFLCASTV